MYFSKLSLVLIILLGALVVQAETVLERYQNILAVIERVEAGEKKALDELMKISLGEHPLELSEDIIKTVVLGLMKSKDPKKLEAYLKKVDEGSVKFLSDKKFQKECDECEGEGHQSTDCKSCVFGKCDNCKGVGFIKYKGFNDEDLESICNKCQGAKKCITCGGSGDLEHDCASCNKGSTFDNSSVFTEYKNSVSKINSLLSSKISQMEKVEVSTNTEVNENKKVSSEVNIEEDYKLTQVKKVDEDEPDEEKEKLKLFKDSRLERAFNEVKKLITNHQNRYSQTICNSIDFILSDDVPTLVLDLNKTFVNNIGQAEKEIIHNFEKFWEVRAILNGYENKVKTELLNNDKNVNALLEISEFINSDEK